MSPTETGSRLTRMHNLAATFALIVCLTGIQAAWAGDADGDRLRLSGFGTVGVVNSGDDELGFRRDITRDGLFDGDWATEPDSIFGLQLNAKLSDRLSAVVQLVARDHPERTFENALEWAFLRFDHSPDLTFRAGRMSTDLFMLSEYRNVGFAYLWVRPPVEFYGALALDSYDGLDVRLSKNLRGGLLQLKVFAGQAEVFAGGIDQSGGTQVGAINVEIDPIVGANLTWESAKWRSRLVAVQTTYDSTLDPLAPLIAGLSSVPSAAWPAAAELASQLETRGKVMRYYSLGAAYDDNPWEVQGELGFIESGSQATLPDLFTAYLSVGRQFESLTVYGLAAIARNTENTLDVPAEPSGGTNPLLVALEQGTRFFVDQRGTDQHSLSLGMRKNLRHNIALKLQWDRTWVEAFGTVLWDQAGPVNRDHTVDTFSVNINFVF